MTEANKPEISLRPEKIEGDQELVMAKRNELRQQIEGLKNSGASTADLNQLEEILAEFDLKVEEILKEKPKALRSAKEIAMEKAGVNLATSERSDSEADKEKVTIQDFPQPEKKLSASLEGDNLSVEVSSVENKKKAIKNRDSDRDRDSIGDRDGIDEIKKSPEYKKAQEYAEKLKAKISEIIKPIQGKKSSELKEELNDISKYFWFFCKDMAANDMEEFDYQAKVEMMEKHFQKTVAKIEKLAADYRQGGKVEPEKKIEKEPELEKEEQPTRPEILSLSGDEIARLSEILAEGDILLIEGTRWKIKNIDENDIVTMRVVATTSKSGNKIGTEEKIPLSELTEVAKRAGQESQIEGLAEQLDLEEKSEEVAAQTVGDKKDDEAPQEDFGLKDVLPTEEELLKERPNDKEVVLAAVKNKGENLQYASEELRDDKEVVLAAIENDNLSLQYASEELRNNKEVVLAAIGNDGWALQFSSAELLNNKEVVLAAVENNGLALQYASEELRNDKEVVLAAVKNSGLALQYASEELRNDKEVVLTAVKNNGLSLKFASEELRNDKEVVLAAVENDNKSFQFVSEELRDEINKESLEKPEEIEIDPKDVVEDKESDAGKEILDDGLSEKKKRKGFSRKRFKEVFSNSEQRRAVVKAIYDTLGVLSGYKFAGDLVLGAFGKGDIYNYLRQKTEIKKEKRIVKESLVKGEKERVKQVIEASKNISSEEKKVLLDRLEAIDQEYQEKSTDLEEEKKAKVQEELNLYIQNKIKGAKIAKDAANLVLMRAGFGMLRGGSYLLASMIERGQKASDSYKKGVSTAEVKESKIKFILRDLLVNSTRETLRALAGKGKTKESEHKRIDQIQAFGTLARGLGIAYIAVTGEPLPIGKLLEALRQGEDVDSEDLITKGSEVAAANKSEPALTSLDSSEIEKPDFKMATAAAESSKAPIIETKQILEDMAIDSEDSSQVMAETTTDSSVVEQTKAVVFEKKIDSSQVKGSDSIWRSAKTLFIENAKELGYKGDLENSEALAKWAENQTANTVAALNQEQGGNLTDLVHDGDTVKIEILDGKPKLIFEASSGVEAGHLSDTNVGQMFEQTSFEEGIGHELKIDASTGDQYLEVKTEEGVYKIYDWDRDGQPNLISPDGSHQEMSPEKLSNFLMEKNIIEPTAPEAPDAPDAPDAAEAARQTLVQKIDSFIDKGEGSYSSDMFALAKEQGRLDEVFRGILAKGDSDQAGIFVRDYFQDNNLNDNKRDVFLFELHRALSTAEIKSEEITIAKMLESFDQHTIKDLDSLIEKFDSPGGDKELVAIEVNGQYALVKRVDAFGGAFAKGTEDFYIDTDGDSRWDLKIKGVKNLKKIFEGKIPLIKS